MSTVYKIQHDTGDGEWYFSNLNLFGTPKSFYLGVATNIPDAFAGLDWLSAKHPSKSFRVMEVETSYEVVERPEPVWGPILRDAVIRRKDGAIMSLEALGGGPSKAPYWCSSIDGESYYYRLEDLAPISSARELLGLPDCCGQGCGDCGNVKPSGEGD